MVRKLAIAPGWVVRVRDEQWLVTGVESTADGWLATVQGLSEHVRETTATFYDGIDPVTVVDPAATRVIADDSPRYRRTWLWLETTLRKTPLPIDDPSLTISSQDP